MPDDKIIESNPEEAGGAKAAEGGGASDTFTVPSVPGNDEDSSSYRRAMAFNECYAQEFETALNNNVAAAKVIFAQATSHKPEPMSLCWMGKLILTGFYTTLPFGTNEQIITKDNRVRFAAEWYLQAAQHPSLDGAIARKQALYVLRESAESGIIESQYYLGFLILNDDFSYYEIKQTWHYPSNFLYDSKSTDTVQCQLAAHYLKAAADEGHADAQLAYADLIHRSQNVKVSTKYYLMAAFKGHRHASDRLQYRVHEIAKIIPTLGENQQRQLAMLAKKEQLKQMPHVSYRALYYWREMFDIRVTNDSPVRNLFAFISWTCTKHGRVFMKFVDEAAVLVTLEIDTLPSRDQERLGLLFSLKEICPNPPMPDLKYTNYWIGYTNARDKHLPIPDTWSSTPQGSSRIILWAADVDPDPCSEEVIFALRHHWKSFHLCIARLPAYDQTRLGKLAFRFSFYTPKPDLKYTHYWKGYLKACLWEQPKGNIVQNDIDELRRYREWIVVHIGEFDADDQVQLGWIISQSPRRAPMPDSKYTHYWKGYLKACLRAPPNPSLFISRDGRKAITTIGNIDKLRRYREWIIFHIGEFDADEQERLGQLAPQFSLIAPKPDLTYTHYWKGYLKACLWAQPKGNIDELRRYREWIFFHIGEFDAKDQHQLGKLDLEFNLSLNILPPSLIHEYYWQSRSIKDIVAPIKILKKEKPSRHELSNSCKTKPDSIHRYTEPLIDYYQKLAESSTINPTFDPNQYKYKK